MKTKTWSQESECSSLLLLRTKIGRGPDRLCKHDILRPHKSLHILKCITQVNISITVWKPSIPPDPTITLPCLAASNFHSIHKSYIKWHFCKRDWFTLTLTVHRLLHTSWINNVLCSVHKQSLHGSISDWTAARLTLILTSTQTKRLSSNNRLSTLRLLQKKAVSLMHVALQRIVCTEGY